FNEADAVVGWEHGSPPPRGCWKTLAIGLRSALRHTGTNLAHPGGGEAPARPARPPRTCRPGGAARRRKQGPCPRTARRPSSVFVAGTGRPKTSTQNCSPSSFCRAFFALSSLGLHSPSLRPLAWAFSPATALPKVRASS